MLSEMISPSKNTSRLSHCNGRNVTTSKRKRKFYNYSWMLLGLSLGLSYCSISHQWLVLQIRAGQQSIMPIPCLLLPIPTMQWSLWLVAFPRNLFLLILLFPRNHFEHLELVFLEFKTIYKTQRASLFSFYLFIFYSLFCNHFVY